MRAGTRGILGCLILLLINRAARCDAAGLDGRTSFIVSVTPGQLDQVEAAYRQQGYVVQRRDDKRSLLVVRIHSDTATISAASAQDSGGTKTPGWISYGPHVQQQVSDAWGQLTAANNTIDGFNVATPSYSLHTEPKVSAAAAVTAQAAVQLAAVGGVKHVQQNSVMTLLGQPGRPRRDQKQRSLLQSAAAGKTYEFQPSQCPAAVGSFPDLNLGRTLEGTPYGVHMVEADTERMIQISKDYKSKVMWCVVDTGLDITNPEFDPAATTGCLPGVVRGDGTSHNCDSSWYDDEDGHGTHTSGTIAALRNGKAVIGVSAEGANIYHYNIFGSRDSFFYTDLLWAWDDCINELDWRKTSTPDLKMVVSMSVGGPGDVDVVAQALAAIAAARPDVLFVAAAGNSGDSTINFPGGDPNVVSVAAVDWAGSHAYFSTHNTDVEWAAPGVLTLSTVPMWAASQTSYSLQVALVVTPFVPPVNAPDILENPRVLMMDGSAKGEVRGPLVDCALGTTPCSNATGKICLMQRGGNVSFCTKVANCLTGGGIGAVIYGRDDQQECQQLSGLTLNTTDCLVPAQGWPVVLTATRGQGLWLKDGIADGVTVTLRAETDTNGQSLNFLSGTSMATPTAAGVAGLLWSYHTNCSASDLRAAISASATDLGAPGRDDYYGYGLVNATAAHNYLLQNPCAPPPQPPPVNCSGIWDWSACDKPCGGGHQTGTYKVFKAQAYGGQPCPAAAGSTQMQECNTQICLQAADDNITVTSGRWTAVPILANDAGESVALVAASQPDSGGTVKLGRASKGVAKVNALGTLTGSNVVYYLSKPGFVGLDRFMYSIADATGAQQNATVTVQVTAGDCKVHNCTTGSCSAQTGTCICSAPGMVPTFVRLVSLFNSTKVVVRIRLVLPELSSEVDLRRGADGR